jgi:hypothetical protein
MADECVAAVVNRQRPEAIETERTTGRAEPLAQRVAREGRPESFPLLAANDQGIWIAVLAEPPAPGLIG